MDVILRFMNWLSEAAEWLVAALILGIIVSGIAMFIRRHVVDTLIAVFLTIFIGAGFNIILIYGWLFGH